VDIKGTRLPARLADLILSFASNHMDLSCQEGSVGRCVDMAHAFRIFLQLNEYHGSSMVSWSLERHGLASEQTRLPKAVPVPHNYYHGLDFESHHATLVDGFVVDFTATQFMTGAPFPLVWHVEDEPVEHDS
jgi:hypothetical protein